MPNNYRLSLAPQSGVPATVRSCKQGGSEGPCSEEKIDLGGSWRLLGASWRRLKASWELLGESEGHLGGVMRGLGDVWRRFEASSRAVLGTKLARPRASWRHLGGVLEKF